MAQALVGTVQPTTYASYPSPDGEWRVDVVIYACTIVDPETQQENSLEQLILVSAADGSRSVLDTQMLNCGGLGAAGFEGLFWTPDGAHFYYTRARDGVPDGCGYWEKPLGRFNIIEGQAEYVGGGPFSPDGSRIATWIDHSLTLWDVSGDRIGSVPHPIEDAFPGPIAWSPNGLSVAYLLSEGYCPLGTTHLVRMDLGTLNPVVVLSSIAPSFAGIVWDGPNRVIVSDEQSTTWSYDFDSGKLGPSSE
ncbi:MAG: WD40 repeat domain-containing protein [Actinomycetota bacterium]